MNPNNREEQGEYKCRCEEYSGASKTLRINEENPRGKASSIFKNTEALYQYQMPGLMSF